MEDTFNKLKRDGHNSVDNLIAWMKDSKIVDGVKITEENARKLFDDVKDKHNVEIEKFKQAIATLAAEQKTNVEAYTKTLAKEGEKFFRAASAAAGAAAKAATGAASSAFKEAMEKK
ncbi:uncharacterized protein LOC120628243 isoform X2 [Pararge aegeria]|uniref:Jg10176 protein n=1 Tax=Pararge aegeria aegeria TaxID=348720 RepID=A0A8S4S9P7_9NEOP|nr:uncharacterized protein LOC120628243 isoform X2 [Pararge aegeria]CAH2252707.1 jg10176 [Pararge aegeria aegeria]